MLRNLLHKTKSSSRITSLFSNRASNHRIHLRRLLCEPLEDRRLLTVGMSNIIEGNLNTTLSVVALVSDLDWSSGNWGVKITNFGSPGSPQIHVDLPGGSNKLGNALEVYYAFSGIDVPEIAVFLTDGFWRQVTHGGTWGTSERLFRYHASNDQDCDNSIANHFQVVGVNADGNLSLKMDYDNDSTAGDRFDVHADVWMVPPSQFSTTADISITVTNASGRDVVPYWDGHRQLAEQWELFGMSSMYVADNLTGGLPGWYDGLDPTHRYVGITTDGNYLNDGYSVNSGVYVSTHDVKRLVAGTSVVNMDHNEAACPVVVVPGYDWYKELVMLDQSVTQISLAHQYDSIRNHQVNLIQASGITSNLNDLKWAATYNRNDTNMVDGDNVQVKIGLDDFLNVWPNGASQTILLRVTAGKSPEITVEGMGQNIADGDTTPSSADGTDFGTLVGGGAVVTRTFTVRNTGTADLTLGTLSLPSGYSITEPLSGMIAAGSSDTFTVRLNTTTAGTFYGNISFSTNDSDENPFNFRITGTVTLPFTIDNSRFLYNGKPVFLNIIGYQPLEPGQSVTGEIRETRIEDDLRRFQEYQNGNDVVALRVYAQPTEEYPVRMPKLFYDGVRDLDFWIIRYIYFGDYKSDNAVTEGYKKIDAIINEVETVGGFDRILAWEIGDEFFAKNDVEKDKLKNFLEEMRDYIKDCMDDPSRQGFSKWVTWATWPPSDLLGTDGMVINVQFDIYSINAYSYDPERIRDHQSGPVTGTSYAGYLRALKEKLEELYPGTPLVVSETGYPDSPEPVSDVQESLHPWSPIYRKGGLNGQQVAEGLVDRYMDARLTGFVAGMAVFEWNDEWWKSGEPDNHNGAEEFFGLGQYELVGTGEYQFQYKLQQEAIRNLFTLNFYPDKNIIADLKADKTLLQPGEDTTLHVTVSPGVSGPVRFRWESSNGRIVGDSDTARFIADRLYLGSADVTVVAIDAHGNASTLSLTIDIESTGIPLVEIFTRNTTPVRNEEDWKYWVVSGRIANLDLNNFKLVCYSETNVQYLQPQGTILYSPVSSDGYWWAKDINPGTLRVYVIPRGDVPPPELLKGEVPPSTIASAVFDGSNDTDEDLLPDNWEQQYFGNLNQNRYGDPDKDSAYNLEEYLASISPAQFIDGGNPTVSDNDQDKDALFDNWEYLYFRTLAYKGNDDPDHDGLTNAQELALGIHPGRTAPDSDQDGMPDLWEMRYFGKLTPGPGEDPNHDGQSNLASYRLGIVPVTTTISTPGLYAPVASTFFLRNSNDRGVADETFMYGLANCGWKPIAGDWDGNGMETVGLYNPVTAMFYLRNSNDKGVSDITFNYGPGNSKWIPIAGDWNGDGKDTVGLYNPANATFYLRNSNDRGVANITFNYGPGNSGWKPVVGDWDNDGKDTIGLYNSANAMFYLRNTNDRGVADITFNYGPGNSKWIPIVGDWDGDGKDTIGLYNPAIATFYLRNGNNRGVADITFNYGPGNSNWTPIVGDWNGRASSLITANGAMPAGPGATQVTQASLAPIVNTAIANWASVGLSSSAVDALAKVRFAITDLPGSRLGMTEGSTIYIDQDAAGHGWFIDSTPQRDEEFQALGANGPGRAIDPRAVDRLDLLTVVSHELGHTLGLADLDSSLDGLMSGALKTGMRRKPGVEEVDSIFAGLKSQIYP